MYLGVGGTWLVAGPDTTKDFPGTGLFLGQQLHMSPAVPVGLIDTSWGGTMKETWLASGP
ncbi:MAG: hypothetical protein ACYTKD_22475 [Planctomycetota bacterium]|jgi:sialate O-acetylesterase